jgi:hypothetical protein
MSRADERKSSSEKTAEEVRPAASRSSRGKAKKCLFFHELPGERFAFSTYKL